MKKYDELNEEEKDALWAHMKEAIKEGHSAMVADGHEAQDAGMGLTMVATVGRVAFVASVCEAAKTQDMVSTHDYVHIASRVYADVLRESNEEARAKGVA